MHQTSVSLMEGEFSCNACRILDPNGNAEFRVEFPGISGTSGLWSLESGMAFKVAHLRDLCTARNGAVVAERIELLIARAGAGDCDLDTDARN